MRLKDYDNGELRLLEKLITNEIYRTHLDNWNPRDMYQREKNNKFITRLQLLKDKLEASILDNPLKYEEWQR